MRSGRITPFDGYSMEYSDENFERFSAELAGRVSPGELLWQVRDALFNAITYRSASEEKLPARNRFGWLGYVLWWLLKGRAQRGSSKSLEKLAAARQAYLFLEARDAHFMTLYPLLREAGAEGVAWLADESIRTRLDDQSASSLVAGQWVPFVRLRDFFSIARLLFQARRLAGKDCDLETQGRLTEYLAQFFAWKRFWTESLSAGCVVVYTTSESAPLAKALFAVAKERELRRVHWCHGLRHATWQVTLASELVCNTEGDVRYFVGRVPAECKAVCRSNPRVLAIAKAVGTPRVLDAGESPNILFMSQGPESPYTPQMRLDDLKLLGSLVVSRNGALRVRPHPRENLELLKEALAKAGIQRYEFSTEGLVEDLQWSDIVGTSWSTGLLEAHACGRECYWINNQIESFPVVQELVEEGIGFIFKGKDV